MFLNNALVFLAIIAAERLKKKKVDMVDMVTGTIHKSNVPLHILCNHTLPSKKLPIFKLANSELETVQNRYLNS